VIKTFSEMSEYDYVSRSSLKLKAKDGIVIKSKNKKKNKNKSIEEKQLKKMIEKSVDNKNESDDKSQTVSSTSKTSIGGQEVWMTSAEKKFLEQQQKRQLSRVMSKASKSHKQRVEEFNRHLENLTEHYDIPKVSWTK